MPKVKIFSVLTLAILATFFLVAKVSARQLTTAERQTYAQNNILFYVPCDTLEDCEPEESADQEAPFSGDPSTVPGEGAEKIVNFAIKSSWPNENGQCRDGSTYVNWVSRTEPRGCNSTVTDFAKSYGKQDGDLRDCGKFVGFVLRNTVDPNARASGTYSQSAYFDSAPSKWSKVSTDNQAFPISQLQPGDILVYGDPNRGSDGGHIKIYIGERTITYNGTSTRVVNTAEASYSEQISPYLSKMRNTYFGTNKPYSVYRYIGS